MYQSQIFPLFYSRGVLQALIKKHFPAPGSKKVEDLFGIDVPGRLTPVKRRKKGHISLIHQLNIKHFLFHRNTVFIFK